MHFQMHHEMNQFTHIQNTSKKKIKVGKECIK